ncbi:hypothetical protein QJS10_CPA16g01812 [Acorus calamus]|uniref:Uncharacterized protein n=1 Tax=Acorus calamus TaxID=4465 RepID=A0AAV9CZI8_ACOCL|nr:hypothetical protein QJS10_CPA16g01812 [Acorus calamus]
MKSMGPESASDPVVLASESDLSHFRSSTPSQFSFEALSIGAHGRSLSHAECVRSPQQDDLLACQESTTKKIREAITIKKEVQSMEYKDMGHGHDDPILLKKRASTWKDMTSNNVLDEYQKNFGESWKTA